MKKIPITKEYTNQDGSIDVKENFNVEALISDFGSRLSAEPNNIIYTESTIKFVLGAIFLCLLIVGYIVTSQKKYINGKEYGTAAWGKAIEIKHLLAKNVKKSLIKEIKKDKELSEQKKQKKINETNELCSDDSNMILTQNEKICIHNRELNNNTLVIGGSGSGKTRGIVMPNLLQAHSSFVITDPKGEILSKSGYYLEKQGYKICALNLFEMNKSSFYNPFAYIKIDRADFEENVLTLIETIIVNTDGGQKQKSSDPFWDKAEKLFLQSIFFFVAIAFPKSQRNMNTVMEMIRMLKIEEDGDNRDSDLDLMFARFEQKYGSDNIAVLQFKEFREKSAGKTAKSIVISAVARLAPYNLANVKKLSKFDSMNLDKVGEEKTALFIIMPPTNDTFNFIAGMVFTQLFQELNYSANALHGGHLPVPVRFIMDEFANTCTVPNFVKILAYARSLGIGIMPILQSLEQIKNMYKDEWQVILDNCNTLVFLGGVRNMETLEYVSKLLGKGTFDKKNYSRTKGRQSSTSTSFDKFGRELLDPAEIQKMKKNRCLLFVSGYNPFFSNKFNYKNHKNYKYTSDGNKKYAYVYKTPDIERDKITHGEERKECIPTPDLITFNYNEEENIKMLQEKLLGMDFDNDEVLTIDKGDFEEILFEESIQKEVKLQSQEVTEISKMITMTVINNAELLDISEKFNENIQNINFDNIEADEEIYEDDSDIEIIDDIDTVLNNAFGLRSEVEDMNSFKNDLLKVDISDFEDDKEIENNISVSLEL